MPTNATPLNPDEIRRRLLHRVGEATRRLTSPTGAANLLMHDPGASFGLTEIQQAYLVGRLDEVELGGAGCQSYIEFDVLQIDVPRCEAAIGTLVARHEMLRAVVTEGDRQRILPEVPRVKISILDLRDLAHEDRERRLLQLRETIPQRSFDVTKWPWFDFQVTHMEGSKSRLHVSLDMMMLDGPSVHLLLAELWALYEGSELAPAPSISFSQYVTEVARLSLARDREAADRYWDRWLDNPAGGPEIPVRDLASARLFKRRSHRIAPPLWDQLKARAQSLQVSVVALLLTTYAEVLFRWSGTPRFTINLTFYDRHMIHPDVSRVVGNFTSTLLLGAEPMGWSDPCAAVRTLHEALWEAMDHRSVSGIEVMRRLTRRVSAEDDHGGIGVAKAPVVFTSMIGTGRGAHHRDWTEAYGISRTPQVLIDCQVYEDTGGLRVAWDVLEDAFEPGVVNDMFDAFCMLLVQTWKGDSPVAGWSPPSPTPEPHAFAPTSDALIHDGFIARVHDTPDATALIHSGRSISYRQLHRHAQNIASHVIEQNARIVAVLLPKGVQQIAALLGIAIGGGTYLPIPPDTPDLRIARLLKASGADLIILSEGDLQRHALVAVDVKLLTAEEALRPCTPTRLRHAAERDDLAYIIFTSGSTGDPKGVAISHAAAVNTIEAVSREFAVGPGDRVLALSSFAFDLSVYDIFGMLGAGGCVVIPDESVGHDPQHWRDLMAAHDVTLWNSVPALFDLLVDDMERRPGGLTPSSRLRVALLSGDWIPVNLPFRARALFPGLEVVSLGGATEAAIWSVWYRIGSLAADMPSVPYGTSMPGQRLLVLDPRGNICPAMVPGDLYIDGIGLAEGYVGKPIESAAAFGRNAHTRQPMYRTGDRARLLRSGELQFLGRGDRQIKLRGHRIELGEIECALREFPGVIRCVASVVVFASGQAQLVAHVVLDQASPAREGEIAEHLRSILPAQMLPHQIVILDELPLTSNGKLDLSALTLRAAPNGPAVSRAGSAVRDIVIGLFRTILNGRNVDAATDLHRAGGTSLDAVRIVTRARQTFHCDIPLRRFLAEPSVACLTALVDEQRLQRTTVAGDRGPIRSNERRFPLSAAQAGLWTLYRAAPTDVSYNTVDAFHIAGEVLTARLREALGDVVRRHDALRTTFIEDAGVPWQHVEATEPDFKEIQLALDEDPHAAVVDYARIEAETPFNLQTAPGARFTLLKASSGDHFIIVAMHHIICDAWSLAIFCRDLAMAYASRSHGGGMALPPEIQPGDLELWRTARKSEQHVDRLKARWCALLANAPLFTSLPIPAVETDVQGTRAYFVIDEVVATRLQGIASGHSASLYIVLLHLFARAIGELTAQRDMVIGTPVSDRYHPLAEELIGMFINTIPIRLTLSAAIPSESLRRTRDQVLEAMDIRELPLQDIVRAVNPPRQPKRSPLFNVLFAVQEGALVEANALKINHMPTPLASAKFDLTLECRPQAGGIGGFFEYRPSVVDADFVKRLEVRFTGLCASFASELETESYLENAFCVSGSEVDLPLPLEGLAGFFLEQRDICSEAIAIETPSETISYSALADRAARVAAQLAQQGPGQIVALLGSPGPEVVTGILGALLAGRSFALIDESTPATRVSAMLSRIEASSVLDASPQRAARYPNTTSIAMLLDGPNKSVLRRPAPEPAALAYVAFTSGSTGHPAAVAVPHEAICRRIKWGCAEQTVRAYDRVLMMTPIGFDVVICEVFETIATGATLVAIPGADLRSAAELARVIDTYGITVVNMTPSLLSELLAVPEFAGASLRRVNCGAEKLPPRLAQSFLSRFPHAELYNIYGLTECAVDSLMQRCLPGYAGAVGYPVAGANVIILDDRLHPITDGGVGEIWIGGRGLARCYLGEPSRTASRFLPAPGGGRIYRTGDLGRRLSDGAIELLGRRDEQVKIRGVRIELREIEAALRALKEVRDCIVVSDSIGSSDIVLGALVTGRDLTPGGVRAHLMKHLSSAFVPSRIGVVASLPRGPNGKLDPHAARVMLRELAREGQVMSPRNANEQLILALFEQVLDRPIADICADFFDLGGHSLLAGRLAMRIGQQTGYSISIADVLENPTVEMLAARLSAPKQRDPGIVTMRVGTEPPLFVVHPLSGEVVCYAALARQFTKGRAVVGLRDPDGEWSDIAALAGYHAARIVARQPSGRIAIAGWSAGGVLALAIAAELERVEREVMLTVIDSDVAAFDDRVVSADDLLPLIVTELSGRQALAEACGDFASTLGWLQKHELLPWENAEQILSERIARAVALDHALRRYAPDCIRSSITLLRAANSSFGLSNAWQRCTRGRVVECIIPGDHHSMMRHPILAELLEVAGALDD